MLSQEPTSFGGDRKVKSRTRRSGGLCLTLTNQLQVFPRAPAPSETPSPSGLPPVKNPGDPPPADKDKPSPEQVAAMMGKGEKDKYAFYTHVQGDGKDMNKKDMKKKIEEQGQFGLQQALIDPQRGQLDDKTNPNTFLQTDIGKNGREKTRKNKEYWNAVSRQHGKNADGEVTLHTNGPGQLHPHSVWEKEEKPQIIREGGPATKIVRHDHSNDKKKTEWERPDPNNKPATSGEGPPESSKPSGMLRSQSWKEPAAQKPTLQKQNSMPSNMPSQRGVKLDSGQKQKPMPSGQKGLPAKLQRQNPTPSKLPSQSNLKGPIGQKSTPLKQNSPPKPQKQSAMLSGKNSPSPSIKKQNSAPSGPEKPPPALQKQNSMLSGQKSPLPKLQKQNSVPSTQKTPPQKTPPQNLQKQNSMPPKLPSQGKIKQQPEKKPTPQKLSVQSVKPKRFQRPETKVLNVKPPKVDLSKQQSPTATLPKPQQQPQKAPPPKMQQPKPQPGVVSKTSGRCFA